MQPQSASININIIGLNVGGTRFLTTKSTLLNAGRESFFGALLESGLPSAIDQDGNYFLDRDPRYTYIYIYK